MKNKAASTFAAALFSLSIATASFADTSQQWLHVKVEGADSERVSVNLPLALVESALALIPEDFTQEMEGEIQVAIDDVNMDWKDLRAFWQSVKDTPEATFATVETKDERVVVKKEGRFLKVKTTESGENGTHVDVQLPIAVVDALFSGPEGTLNFPAAVKALAEQAENGSGHLVQVRDGDETVRVWIDNNDTAE